MLDAAGFQQMFGAALAGELAIDDVAVTRALAVHRNTAAKAARDALADNYPVVGALVGDEAFDAVAAAFVAAHPPAEPRLCLYGDGFPAFLADFAPFADLAYLGDVATVERMTIEALFAADAAALDGAAFAAGIDLDAPLALHPAARFAALASPAGTIWQAHQPGASEGALGNITWAAEVVLVTRPGGALIVTALPQAAAAFLAACRDGQTLGQAAAAVPEADVATLFTTLITAGAFA